MKYRNKLILILLIAFIVLVNAFTIKHIYDYYRAQKQAEYTFGIPDSIAVYNNGSFVNRFEKSSEQYTKLFELNEKRDDYVTSYIDLGKFNPEISKELYIVYEYKNSSSVTLATNFKQLTTEVERVAFTLTSQNSNTVTLYTKDSVQTFGKLNAEAELIEYTRFEK